MIESKRDIKLIIQQQPQKRVSGLLSIPLRCEMSYIKQRVWQLSKSVNFRRTNNENVFAILRVYFSVQSKSKVKDSLRQFFSISDVLLICASM